MGAWLVFRLREWSEGRRAAEKQIAAAELRHRKAARELRDEGKFPETGNGCVLGYVIDEATGTLPEGME